MYCPCSVYLLSGTHNISAGDYVAYYNGALFNAIATDSRNGIDGLPTSTPYTSEHHATVSESGVYTAILVHAAQNCDNGTEWSLAENIYYVQDVLTINVTLADSGGGNSGTGTSVSYTNTVTPGDGYYYRALLDTSATNPAYCRTPVAIVDTPSEPGAYYYRAVVTDDATTYITNSANATLEAVPADTTPPVITLTGDASCSITVGDTWTDPGATATDNVDASVAVTSSITLGGQAVQSVDTSTAGTYTITYSASDAAGNAATPVTRTVVVNDVPPPVTDTTPPVITLSGQASITLTVGDTWVDPGATATDDTDASVTVTTTGTVDTSTAGTYTLTYNATDAAGNAATPVTRTVLVQAAAPTEPDPDTEDDPPQSITYSTTAANAIPPNQKLWFRACVTDAAATTPTTPDAAWLTRLRTIKANGSACEVSGFNFSFYALLWSNLHERLIKAEDIASITYTLYKKHYYLTDHGDTVVSGHENVNVPLCPHITESPLPLLGSASETYNFAFWLSDPTLSLNRKYDIIFKITDTNGTVSPLVFQVQN